jgi:hypothetical protein
VKGAHLRRRRFDLTAYSLMALAAGLIGYGTWHIATHSDPGRASAITPNTTTSTTEFTTTTLLDHPPVTLSTDVTETTITVPKNKPIMKPVAAHSAPVAASTTTTAESPKTPLQVALKYLGQTGPWADGGFYCAKFVSYVADEAELPGFIPRDGPSALYADALRDGRLTQDPVLGGMIFIDLFGPDGIGHGQVTHVGIVEYVDGSTVGIVQGNGAPDPSVITRTTYHLGDGYVVGFAPFEAAS